ncbi:MAG: ceramidase domain-containing protein [Pseudomonadota bacterium]
MDLTRRIDGYCERMSEAFWAEPINAVTNIAFIIAAVLVYLFARRMGRLDGPTLFLICNLTAIGIGSFLFHTFATVWAAMTDTIPILFFILAYFAIAMRRFVGLSLRGSAIATALLILALPAASGALRPLLLPVIGGSVSYVPALLMLLAVGTWLWRQGHEAGRNLIIGAGIFACSLTFRALDQQLCDVFPGGTHFLWHILNGTLLGFLIYTFILYGHGTTAMSRLRGTA